MPIDSFETLTMAKILLRQGDQVGAIRLYQKLRTQGQGQAQSGDAVFDEDFERLIAQRQECLDRLEKWVNALKE